MADSLRARVARVIAGSAHALIDKIEDAAPIAMLEQSVREVDQIIDEVRAELGLIAANRHLAQQQHLSLNREHEQLSISLATALAESRDDLAKAAISRQLDIEAQLPILETSLAEQGGREKEMSGFVDALLGKKREMETAIGEFEASRQAAETNAAMTASGTNAIGAKLSAAQSSFDRTYRRQSGLSPTASGTTMEQAARLKELSDLARDNKIAERLAALKSGK
ncbi:MAG: PspA/IM30 family protein [Burkholderiales bacterium]|jgi:phage shock protein A|nr:PspA/IM30 family protein [Rhodocyclaceae bacterium]MCA3055203.1 PspA/IM30 family protein [Rhodocyclaceae bacterium]